MKDDINWDRTNALVSKGLYSGFSRFLLDTSHKQLAKFGNRHAKPGNSILEIGAGKGEHYTFVRSDFSQYLMTDISYWGKTEIEKIISSDDRVRFELQDIEKLSLQANTFDRVICSCVLIHIDQPFQALRELERVTKKGGLISFYIAADPGALLRLMRKIITLPKMKDLGVPYSLLNALSHRNNAGGLVEMSKYVFKDSKITFTYYPFLVKSWNLSTHIIVNVLKK
jgi:ubiquinone/menaquinone biosynthesis C-methylase UbiE